MGPEDVLAKRFRIALSFAGEKRDFVEETARILAERFCEQAILYDKFHEAEFARYDLGIYLPKLYGQQSELIVPILCANYEKKLWTGWEWLHIYGLLTQKEGHRVMPSRFDHANADGLSPAAGFIELDGKTPQQFARLILQRLALNESKPSDYYTRPLPSPEMLVNSPLLLKLANDYDSPDSAENLINRANEMVLRNCPNISADRIFKQSELDLAQFNKHSPRIFWTKILKLTGQKGNATLDAFLRAAGCADLRWELEAPRTTPHANGQVRQVQTLGPSDVSDPKLRKLLQIEDEVPFRIDWIPLAPLIEAYAQQFGNDGAAKECIRCANDLRRQAEPNISERRLISVLKVGNVGDDPNRFWAAVFNTHIVQLGSRMLLALIMTTDELPLPSDVSEVKNRLFAEMLKRVRTKRALE